MLIWCLIIGIAMIISLLTAIILHFLNKTKGNFWEGLDEVEKIDWDELLKDNENK